MRSGVLAIAAVLALAAPLAGAQVYKWVDENGKVNYGEKPPPGVKATELGGMPAPAPAPASGNRAPVQPSWREKELESRRRQIEREGKESAEASQARALEARREADCSDTRRRVAILQEQIAVYERNDKGERVYLEDKDRPGQIARLQRFIAENCR